MWFLCRTFLFEAWIDHSSFTEDVYRTLNSVDSLDAESNPQVQRILHPSSNLNPPDRHVDVLTGAELEQRGYKLMPPYQGAALHISTRQVDFNLHPHPTKKQPNQRWLPHSQIRSLVACDTSIEPQRIHPAVYTWSMSRWLHVFVQACGILKWISGNFAERSYI